MIDFADNWARSLLHHGVHNFLFLAEDDVAHRWLQQVKLVRPVVHFSPCWI